MAALAADPAEEALATRDAYVSPRVLGPAAASEQRLLADAAARLNAEDRQVKLAVVLGPVGSPTLQAYVRTLAERLGFDGTVVVTSPTGAIAAVGPRSAAQITLAIRASGARRIANPVDRLALAAGVAAPVSADPGGHGTRAVVILLSVALLGGLWALALGSGRGERRARREVAEARAHMRICLDALRARATALMRRQDLPAPAREGVGRALNTYADAVTSLQEMRGVNQVDALAPDVHSGMDELARAAEVVGERMPSEDPFAGLCRVDPVHGPGTEDEGLCAACHEAAEEGRRPPPRMLPEQGRAVPFDLATYGPVLRLRQGPSG